MEIWIVFLPHQSQVLLLDFTFSLFAKYADAALIACACVCVCVCVRVRESVSVCVCGLA